MEKLTGPHRRTTQDQMDLMVRHKTKKQGPPETFWITFEDIAVFGSLISLLTRRKEKSGLGKQEQNSSSHLV